MRIGYSENEDYPGQFDLWQANCRRSLQGRAGQAILRELESALVALPDKRLIEDELEAEGDVCAWGALKVYRGEAISDDDRELATYDMEAVGVELGAPRLVAWKVVEVNDLQSRGRYVDVAGPTKVEWGMRRRERLNIFIAETPAERYERVLAWVRRQIRQTEEVAA